MEESPATGNGPPPPPPEFKKPVLIGRVGKLPRKAASVPAPPVVAAAEPESAPEPIPEPAPAPSPANDARSKLPPAVLLKELSVPIPYKEPRWSGLPPEGSNYSLEVLKSGVIVDKVELMTRPYHVFGRLANCDVVMAHPTISRHHAILQYKASAEEGEPPAGFYLWDASSTHGTFLNRERVKPAHYTRVRVGHMIKLGCSTRSYILLGPEWDSEGESELTVTEMRQKHTEMKAEREREIRAAAEVRAREREEEERRRAEGGVDWGMGEDAEEETDLSENPFAATTNEELYLDDPKKTLRGYFEREGLELLYDCQEKAPGQFLCRVELPVEDARGAAVVAEAVHRGKKKDSVVACALEACRILDRHGLLRQAKHESRRRKRRDWSADDYYDSDDDNYLDRTGAVERKRRARMQRHAAAAAGAEPDRPLTYDDLVTKCTELRAQLEGEEQRLARLRAGDAAPAGPERDPLDDYMSSLGGRGQSAAHKADISKSKMEIVKIKAELAKAERLTEIAKPASLPELIKREPAPETSRLKVNQVGQNKVIYGKRLRLKEDTKVKVKSDVRQKVDEEFVEEVDSDEEEKVTDDATKLKKERVDSGDESETKNAISDKPKGDSENSKTEEDITKDCDDKDRVKESADTKDDKKVEKRVFGPMRPPEDYVVPEGYFQAESDRDLPEIMEDDS